MDSLVCLVSRLRFRKVDEMMQQCEKIKGKRDEIA